MREILFRGKRADNGKWVEGHYGEYYSGKENVSCISIPKETISGSLCYDVIPKTVGQYTGLCDKNGTKIFAGDILKGLYANGNAEVEIINGSWVGYAGKGWTDIGYVVDRVEVLGNIHDNPELLNK